MILNLASFDSASWASKVIGSQEIEQYNQSLSYGANDIRDGISLNKGNKEKDLVLPSEFMSLGKLKGYALMTGEFPSALVDFDKLKLKQYQFNNPGFIDKLAGKEKRNTEDV